MLSKYYEGIAIELGRCAAIMKECGAGLNSMRLTGGGARSGLWPDILAAVFDLTTQVISNPGESTSYGAAIVAGVGTGIFAGYDDAAATVSTRSTHQVNPEWRDRYAELIKIYEGIYAGVKPVFDALAEPKPSGDSPNNDAGIDGTNR